MIVSRLGMLFVVLTCCHLSGCNAKQPGPGAPPSPAPTAEAKSTFQDAIAATTANLKGEKKVAHDAAIAAQPFPNQAELMVGKFHNEPTDPDDTLWYEINRNANGMFSVTYVDLFPEEKEYLRIESTVQWMTKGRVLYEEDEYNPEEVIIVLLEDVSETGIKYRTLAWQENQMDYGEELDLRGPAKLPSVPAGWTVVDE